MFEQSEAVPAPRRSRLDQAIVASVVAMSLLSVAALSGLVGSTEAHAADLVCVCGGLA